MGQTDGDFDKIHPIVSMLCVVVIILGRRLDVC